MCNPFCDLYQAPIDMQQKYKSFIFILSSIINLEKIIHNILVKMTTDSETTTIPTVLKQKNKGERPLSTIWGI